MLIFEKHQGGQCLLSFTPKATTHASLHNPATSLSLSWHNETHPKQTLLFANSLRYYIKEIPSFLSKGIPFHNRRSLGFILEAPKVIEIQMLVFSSYTVNFQVL